MPTITAGTSPTITLTAGQQLAFSAGGAGLVTIMRVGALAPLRSMPVGDRPMTVGPFNFDHIVDVYAERTLTYTVVLPNAPTLFPPTQQVVQDPATGQRYAGGTPVLGGGNGTAYSRSNWGTRLWNLGNTGSNNPASIFLGGTFLDDGTDTGTEHFAVELGEFTAIQLIFQNFNANGGGGIPLIISGAKVIAPSDYTDKVADAAFIAGGTTVTFNGGNAGATVPGGLQSNLFFSDPIAITSTPRTDVVGGLPLLYGRIKFAFPQGANSPISSWDMSGGDWATGARQYWQAGAYGDKLSSALGRTPANNSRRCLAGIRYLSPHRVMTIMANGTSLTNNNTNGIDRNPGGWLHASAVANSTLDKPIEYINVGMSSQTSTQYVISALRVLQQLPCTHFLMECPSVNDLGAAPTQATFDTNLRNCLGPIELAQQLHRARIGIWNGYPRSANATTSYYTAGGDALRQTFLTKLSTLGYDLADTNSALGDDARPQRYKDPANGTSAVALTTDYLHPIQAGLDLVKPTFDALFKKWADDYFA